MSDGANVEVTLTVQNNSEVEMGDVVDGYAADQAREYKEKAGEYAVNALNSQNMAEAWAESDSAPAGEGTRSSKVWADTARQWAESTSEPDGVSGARSSKTWSETAQAWAESDGEPDGISGTKSAKTWATISSQKATEATASAKAADTSAKASASSAAAAKTSQEGATTQATRARQSAESAAEKLAQMQIDLKDEIPQTKYQYRIPHAGEFLQRLLLPEESVSWRLNRIERFMKKYGLVNAGGWWVKETLKNEELQGQLAFLIPNLGH